MHINHTISPSGLGLNTASPTIMHIDLNSCFATIEQQAKKHWRAQPVGVVAYDSPGGIILAASYEAKALGIKLGTRVWEAQKICPGIKICLVDPPKYRQAHRLFRNVLEQYTSNVTPKSIDEFVIDFRGSQALGRGMSMEDIGYEIKEKIWGTLGEAVNCNVGIAPNRLLAKLAAGLHKPNGLDVIDSKNIPVIYPSLELTDLPGINQRYSTRLRLAGIRTVNNFLEADPQKLRAVFGGIVGYYWWLRLRGWEIDDRYGQTGRQIGHQYALREKLTYENLDPIIFKLSQKIARRLGKKEVSALGIRVGLRFVRSPYWHISKRVGASMVGVQDIFVATKKVLKENAPAHAGLVSLLSVTVYDFQPILPEQMIFNLYSRPLQDKHAIATAMNSVNDRFGDLALVPATMLGTEDIAKDSIAFGSLSD